MACDIFMCLLGFMCCLIIIGYSLLSFALIEKKNNKKIESITENMDKNPIMVTTITKGRRTNSVWPITVDPIHHYRYNKKISFHKRNISLIPYPGSGLL